MKISTEFPKENGKLTIYVELYIESYNTHRKPFEYRIQQSFILKGKRKEIFGEYNATIEEINQAKVNFWNKTHPKYENV